MPETAHLKSDPAVLYPTAMYDCCVIRENPNASVDSCRQGHERILHLLVLWCPACNVWISRPRDHTVPNATACRACQRCLRLHLGHSGSPTMVWWLTRTLVCIPSCRIHTVVHLQQLSESGEIPCKLTTILTWNVPKFVLCSLICRRQTNFFLQLQLHQISASATRNSGASMRICIHVWWSGAFSV